VEQNKTDKLHSDTVTGVSWRQGGKEFAASSLDKTVSVWSVDGPTIKRVRTLKDHADAVLGVAYSPDGKFLVTASVDRSAKLFNADTGKILCSIAGHNDTVTSAAWNATGNLLVTASMDKVVRFWKVQNGIADQNPERNLYLADGILSCGFGGTKENGSKTFVCSAKDGGVRMASGDKAEWEHHYGGADGSTDYAHCVVARPDGEQVAVGADNGVLRVWNVADRKRIVDVRIGAKAEAPKAASNVDRKTEAK
jgi:WD40 repeat protein